MNIGALLPGSTDPPPFTRDAHGIVVTVSRTGTENYAMALEINSRM
jgi:hypothetical protein